MWRHRNQHSNCSGGLAFRGGEDLDCRKIAAIARSIAREQGKVSDGGVRANVEIRGERGPATPRGGGIAGSSSQPENRPPREALRADIKSREAPRPALRLWRSEERRVGKECRSRWS